MLRSTCFALLLVIASSAGAAVQTPAPPAPAAAPPTPAKPSANKSDLDKIVCEKQETTGTRLGAKKVCLTVAQWIEFRRDEQDQLQHLQANIGIASH